MPAGQSMCRAVSSLTLTKNVRFLFALLGGNRERD